LKLQLLGTTLQARHGDRFAPRQGWDMAVLREPVA
jgi:3-hydroxyacyl-CoA dehydrogenase/enoyl-CoA hydratase/3-hydroxybutyryl-CoA epimerase